MPKISNPLISGFSENCFSRCLPDTCRAENLIKDLSKRLHVLEHLLVVCKRLYTLDLGQRDPASSRLHQGVRASNGRRSIKETAFLGCGSESHF